LLSHLQAVYRGLDAGRADLHRRRLFTGQVEDLPYATPLL
jgi:hypothetical protein